jgi:hypothetical protein
MTILPYLNINSKIGLLLSWHKGIGYVNIWCVSEMGRFLIIQTLPHVVQPYSVNEVVKWIYYKGNLYTIAAAVWNI